MLAQVLPIIIALIGGILLGAGWAESAIVKERIRQACRRGFDAGKPKWSADGTTLTFQAPLPPNGQNTAFYARSLMEDEIERHAEVERLIRETGGQP